jgi:UDP-glucose 4-epimerase
MMNHVSMVTGGAGFVGSALVMQLLDVGEQVVVYDNFSFGREENLPSAEALTVVKGDLLDEDTLRSALDLYAPSTVYHLAALHFIPYCNAHPQEAVRTNVEGTLSVLEACKDRDLRCFVNVSTAAVYSTDPHPHQESEVPAPDDIYGNSKLFAEGIARLYHQKSGLPCVTARLFNVVGPRETNPHLLPEIIDQLARGGPIRLGNTAPKRDYIHSDDVASALRSMAAAERTSMETYNVGTGQSYSADDIMAMIQDILGRTVDVQVDPERVRKSDRPDLVADTGKILHDLGWKSTRSLQQTLTELLHDRGLCPSVP